MGEALESLPLFPYLDIRVIPLSVHLMTRGTA